jgi:tRNA (guanine-N7-)-methyltransferase
VSGEHAERHRRKLYGRRKGPKLSPHKSQLFETLLPKLALDIRAGADPRSYFENVEDVWLEIGFGAGEHLLWQAQAYPHVGLIGAEPYESGVAKLLSRISLSPFEGERVGGEGASPPIHTFEDAAPPPHPNPLPQRGRGNIKIHMGDARDIIEALPDGSLGRVFVLFPDPWPKLRHAKRRFIQTEMLDALARAMKPGAELRFASDDAPLVEYTLERLMAHRSFAWTVTHAADWRGRPTDWPQTRYEAKQLHGVPAFMRFIRV